MCETSSLLERKRDFRGTGKESHFIIFSYNSWTRNQGNLLAKSPTVDLKERGESLQRGRKKIPLFAQKNQSTSYCALIYKAFGELVPEMNSVKDPWNAEQQKSSKDSRGTVAWSGVAGSAGELNLNLRSGIWNWKMQNKPEDITPKAQPTKAKIDKWDYNKFKNYCVSKETIGSVKRQPTEQKKKLQTIHLIRHKYIKNF